VPDRTTHAIATVILTCLITPVAVLEPKVAMVSAGVLAGVAVHPDLDASYRPFWRLYARTHRHRGFSHWPVLGTAERAAWVLAAPILAMVVGGWTVPWEAAGLWFAGLCLADLLHEIMDVTLRWD
jgi:uncharacterized metal-binding protein